MMACSSVDQVFSITCKIIYRYIQYCRTTCGPRLNGEATKKLQNQVLSPILLLQVNTIFKKNSCLVVNKSLQYVLMRQGMAEAERSSGKKGAVPITVRQLEAIIRISGNINGIGSLNCSFILPCKSRRSLYSKFRIFGKNAVSSICNWRRCNRGSPTFQNIDDASCLYWRSFGC